MPSTNVSINSNNSLRQLLLSPRFYRDLAHIGTLSRVPQLVFGRAEIQTQGVWLYNPRGEHDALLPFRVLKSVMIEGLAILWGCCAV